MFVDELADGLVNLVNVSTNDLFVGVLCLIYFYPRIIAYLYRSRL